MTWHYLFWIWVGAGVEIGELECEHNRLRVRGSVELATYARCESDGRDAALRAFLLYETGPLHGGCFQKGWSDKE